MFKRKPTSPTLRWSLVFLTIALGLGAVLQTMQLEEIRSQNRRDFQLQRSLYQLENITLQLIRAATTLGAPEEVEERIERVRNETMAIVDTYRDEPGIQELPRYRDEAFEAIRKCVALNESGASSIARLRAEQGAWRASGECIDHIDDLTDDAVARIETSLIVGPGKKAVAYALYALTFLSLIFTAYLFIDRESIVLARRQAQESERRLQAIVEYQLDYFCRFLPDTTIIDVNEVYVRATGRKREALIGRQFIEWIDDDDKERMRDHLRSFTPERPAAVMEHGVTMADGERRRRQWVDLAIFDTDGKILEIQSVGRDITGRERDRREAQERSAMLFAFFNASPSAMDIVQIEGNDLRIIEINEAASSLLSARPEDIRGKLASEYGIDEDTITMWISECEMAARSGQPRHFEYQSSLSRRWLSVRVCAIERGEPGAPMFAAVTEDITEHRNTEQWLRLLNRELNHRVKNNLAVVAALAERTAANTDDFDTFVQQLRERIHGMSLAHDVISQRQWTSASMDALMRRCLADFMREGGQEINVEGPPVELSPRQASMLGLVVRELAVNAAKYGALSTPQGTVDATWELEHRHGRVLINLSWSERGGPDVESPTHHGFGNEMIEQIVIHSLQGDFTSEYAADGFSCRIVIPGDEEPEESLVAQPAHDTVRSDWN